MKTARIYAFGDSQVYGAWDPRGGWCDRVKQRAHGTTIDSDGEVKYQVFNLGIGGEHSRGLLQRMQSELAARHRPDWPAVVIIGTGENDTRCGEDQRPTISIDEYRSNLDELLAIADNYTDKIMLVGLTLTEQKVQVFKDSFLSHDLIHSYNQVAAEFASRHGLPFIDVISRLGVSSAPVYYKDGVHLNGHGHQIVADMVWPELTKLLEG